jgi:acyl-CoA synthetase (AMP-forming)/AMP-acid ligase II
MIGPLLPRDLLARCAGNFPNKTAYWCGPLRRTWPEMRLRALQMGAALMGLGVQRGDTVAILGQESLTIYEHLFACMQIGAVRLGLNWRYTGAELAHVLADSGTTVLLVDAVCVPLDPQIQQLIDSRGIRSIGYGEGHGIALDLETLMAAASTDVQWPDIAPDDALLCTYTSGTTGKPKGVLHHHAGVAQMVFQSLVARGLGPDDIWSTASASSWMTVVHNVLGLGNGMGHVIPDGSFEMVAFLRDLERHKVTAAMLVPTLIRRAIDEVSRNSYDLSSLRLLMYGSAPATPQLIRDAYQAFACEMVQSYGMTEAGWVTQLSAADHRRAIADEPALLRSAGRAGTLSAISIRDAEGRPLPAMAVGDVWATGPMVMRGYIDRPAEEAETLRGGWVVTHDVGYLDERGYLFLTDRRKFLIISGGVNIFPAQIEAVLSEHADVEEAAAVGAPHPEWGEAVVAVIKLRAGRAQPTLAELHRFCESRLNRQERPKHFVFVDDFPRTSTGKLMKQSVKDTLISNLADMPWHASGPTATGTQAPSPGASGDET